MVMIPKNVMTWKSKLKNLNDCSTLSNLFKNTKNTHPDLKSQWRGKLMTLSGDNFLSYKAYTWTIIEKHLRMESDSQITFKKEKIEYLDPNHDNALVISIRMINDQVKRVMIDISSFINIFYFDTFWKLAYQLMTLL